MLSEVTIKIKKIKKIKKNTFMVTIIVTIKVPNGYEHVYVAENVSYQGPPVRRLRR